MDAAEARQLAQALLDALPDAAGVLEADGALMLTNAALEAWGPRGKARGRTLMELFRSAELVALADRAQAGERVRAELVLPANERIVLASCAPLPLGTLVVLRDLTEAKKLESARRDFVANASHELRTPVATIFGAAETLLSGAIALPPDATQFAQMISRHASRLTRLTQDLLDLSRLEAGEWPVSLLPLEVASVAQPAVESLRAKAKEKQLALSSDLPAGLRAQADRRALEQILVNLLDNAVKYTPAGGAVILSGEREGEDVVISVKDTGAGIEKRHLARLFERFYRVDPGRSREGGGTGLGLAIVKHLAQVMGGQVGVESGAGGTRFWVRLKAA